MTVKEFNKIRRSVYDLTMENAEVAAAVNTTGTAYVYEVECGDRHEILIFNHRSQLNDAVLKEAGFASPDAATARLCLTLNRATKCATF